MPMAPQDLAQALDATAAAFGDQPALRFIENIGDEAPLIDWSFEQFISRVRQTANLFRTLGVEPHTSVGIIAPNTPWSQVALLGAELAGVALPINPLLHDENVATLLRAQAARVLVVDSDLARAARLRALVPTLAHILLLDGGADTLPDAAGRMRGDVYVDEPRRAAGEVVAAFHTGGTTGTPKIALHRQSNQLASARGVAARSGLAPGDVVLNPLPLFHVAGSMCVALGSIVAGACQLLPTRSGARHPDFVPGYWAMIGRHGVTVATGVPTSIGAVAATMPSVRPPRLDRLMCGGAALAPAIEAALVDGLGVRMCIVYGMTESAGLLAARQHDEPLACGWIGRAAPGVEIRAVRDLRDASEALPPGAIGHLIARGETIGPGYTDPERNRDLFTADGWLCTGDLGLLDAHGNVRVTGRAKDVIIRGGHNIDASLIEEAAHAHPAVEAAAAVGSPDAYAGELPVLYVQLKPGASLNLAELDACLRERLERPAVPKRIEVMERLPMTAAGKIYKPALAARAVHAVIEGFASAGGVPPGCWEVVDRDGAPLVRFDAPPAQRAAIEQAMAPLTLAFEFVED